MEEMKRFLFYVGLTESLTVKKISEKKIVASVSGSSRSPHIHAAAFFFAPVLPPVNFANSTVIPIANKIARKQGSETSASFS